MTFICKNSPPIYCQPRFLSKNILGRRGRDHMVVGFTTTCAMSTYHHLSCEFEPHSCRGVLDRTLFDCQ
jgi:hypothetical protein